MQSKRYSSAIAVAILGLAMVGAAGPTRENFDNVRTGMTLEQVQKLVGDLTQVSERGKVTTYKLTSHSGDATVAFEFEDGKVIGKTYEATWWPWVDVAAIVGALATTAAASIALWAVCETRHIARDATGFNDLLLRRTARHDHTNLMIQIDKALIDEPQLWAIYDDYAAVADATSSDALDWLRREAFIYLHFNFYDIVFDFYQALGPRKDKTDIAYEKAWRRYAKDLLRGSARAREMCRDPHFDELYDTRFVSYLHDLAKEVDRELAQGSPKSLRYVRRYS